MKEDKLYFVRVEGGNHFSAFGGLGIDLAIQDLYGPVAQLSAVKDLNGIIKIECVDESNDLIELTAYPVTDVYGGHASLQTKIGDL